MVFNIGLICGVVAALAVRGILLAVTPRPRVGQRQSHRGTPPPAGWEHTRNFLYYDGTVMPTSKEEIYE